MNDEYDNNLRGACWPNRNKKSDHHPDYKGSLEIDGVHYWVSMWIDPGAPGRVPPIKFAVQAKDVQPETVEPVTETVDLQALKDKAGPKTDDAKPFDDDIPF